jgi:hypothetical protein
MKNFLLTFLIIIVIIALFVAGSYLYIRFMPEKSITKQTADFTISAYDLAKEYETNQTGSDKKFIDRVIKVTGEISEISTDQNNSIVFILRNKESSTGILCTFNEKATKKATRFKKGDTVSIKGTCSGMLFEVVLNKCIIVD